MDKVHYPEGGFWWDFWGRHPEVERVVLSRQGLVWVQLKGSSSFTPLPTLNIEHPDLAMALQAIPDLL